MLPVSCHYPTSNGGDHLGTQAGVLAGRTAVSQGNSSIHRVTLAGLEVDSKLLLKFADSFKMFNFDVRLVEGESSKDGHAGAVTACVMPLNQAAVICLRNSAWFLPRRTLLYGIGDWSDAAKFSDLGINALLEKTTHLSFRTAVSSTHTLIGRGIDEHARVPIVMSVTVKAEGITVKGITRNLGPGGMAVTLARDASLPDVVDLDFSLPGDGPLSLRGSPRWYSGLLVGLCFEPSASTKTLRKWVSEYSQLGKQH